MTPMDLRITASKPIYSKDAKGQVRSWHTELDGEGSWRVVSGLLHSCNKLVTGWKLCETTNAGKKNERDPVAQALFESSAERTKKLEREYRETVEELDAVPPSPMLAQDYKKQKAIKFPCYEQPKLDGIRALISRHGAFSREFQPHHNVEHILEALKPIFEAHPELVLDGELYNHELRDDFNTISSVVRKQKVKDADRAKARELIQFHVYDQVASASTQFRIQQVFSILTTLPVGSPIVCVPTKFVYSQEQLDEQYGKWMERGYEGQMVRCPISSYEDSKRSKTLLKRKEFETDEFELVDIEPGVGNWAGVAKRVKIRLPNGETQGGGMRGSQAFAKELLENKATYIGSPTTIRYFGVTPDGKLRFPVAVDFHPGGRKD